MLTPLPLIRFIIEFVGDKVKNKVFFIKKSFKKVKKTLALVEKGDGFVCLLNFRAEELDLGFFFCVLAAFKYNIIRFNVLRGCPKTRNS